VRKNVDSPLTPTFPVTFTLSYFSLSVFFIKYGHLLSFQLTKCNCQVVNFGAGFDTLYWRLAEEGRVPKSYVEVDFHNVTSKKCHAIKTKKQLLEKIATEGMYQFVYPEVFVAI
jgi:hypothetical protein